MTASLAARKMAWTFDNRHASLRSGPLAAQVDVAQPDRGVHTLSLNSTSLDGRICAVAREATSAASSSASWPATLADAYVRGDDLVASYLATEEWPFAPQIYWRAESAGPIADVLAAVSLLVSVSTHLLDTHPQISATTALPADELLHAELSPSEPAHFNVLGAREKKVLRPDGGACCIVWRLPGAHLSYAEFVPESDFRTLTIERDDHGRVQARWELIADFLEKGVIRRTRLQATFLPRKDDVELAAACCRQFVQQPLPLTT